MLCPGSVFSQVVVCGRIGRWAGFAEAETGIEKSAAEPNTARPQPALLTYDTLENQIVKNLLVKLLPT